MKGLADYFKVTDNLIGAYMSFTEALSRLTEVVDKVIEAFSIWIIVTDSTVWDISSINKLKPLNKALKLLTLEIKDIMIN